MANFNAINTVNIILEKALVVAIKSEENRDFSPTIKSITVGLSSGTSGNRGVFLASEKERAYWVALVLDRVLGFSFKKRSIAFFLRANSNLYDSVKSKLLAFHFFDLLNPIHTHIERLNALQPTILVAQPSMLLELANAIAANKLDIKPTKVISVAEVLTPEDKAYLSNIFKQTIHQVYQCTEGFLASSCEHGTLHFNEDFLIIEKKYIDQEQSRFHPIITDLRRRSQPIIRYELNDIIQEKTNCPCGSKFLAIKAIEGRSDDILIFKNIDNQEVKIFPDFFRRAIILSDNTISDYALIQNEPNHLMLFIKSQHEESFKLAYAAIQDLLKKNNIFEVEISQINHNHTLRGQKLRRIKNDVRKTY
ncbi:hypothetical protein GCM10011514_28750 [Emticicia aquatilis]|uniref:Adenylate synthase n=2 Tax=Emticicia aquatilis TaxID=1537369 RepID=A0A917DRW8_9BACT|nr:hypothetical protein GCM10011514_28750 [Emticicia aquatilis]